MARIAPPTQLELPVPLAALYKVLVVTTTHLRLTAAVCNNQSNSSILYTDISPDPSGPHDTYLANKLDPRVNTSSNSGAFGTSHESRTHNTGSGLTGSHTHGSDPTGPHSSHLANKADPRVDSDQYGSAGNTAGAGGHGAGQYGSSTGTGLGNTAHSGTGLTGTTHSGTGLGSNTTSGTGLTGSGLSGTGSGITGSHAHGSDPTGPHSSHLANQADPRVDSDRYGSAGNTTGGLGSSTTGTHGTTTGTHGHAGQGPVHNNAMLNKLDPRVDSNNDGVKGVGK
jgi:hypothetical protein